MKEKLNQYRTRTIELWNSRTTKQKGLIMTSVFLFLLIIIGGSILASSSSMVPLYNNLSMQEAGQIQEELDARGIDNEVTDGGTAVHVPEGMADSLLVDLAAQGIPSSGSIDYSFFSENTSWGVTDNEFDMMRLDATQTELENLIAGITGIENASVMINLPQEQVFVSDEQQGGSASIVLTTAAGYNFESEQINALHHLVSKSVPNLSTDDIVIMDQHFNYYDLDQGNNFSNGDIYTTQQDIKNDIERDIQRRVQQMLGTMIGNDRVVASVTADIDFTQEERVEQLVEPVSEEIETLPVSVETIQETYSGEGAFDGEVGAGEEDIMNYPAGEAGQGDYELIQESVNNEFNRIQRDISESPYKVRDLGIQVAVDSTREIPGEDGEREELTAAELEDVENSIASILESIISTSVDQSYGEINPVDNTSIVFQEFAGVDTRQQPIATGIPTWVYFAGGLLLLLVIGLVVALLRRRNQPDEVAYMEENEETVEREIPDMEEPEDTESSIKRKQLEKMAQGKPEEFAKLLRSWISEE
ncbi:flagellar M-ring protein FliF [Pelagirhabdus alkalitolerans]|uniref:Flagellar M-ring protein n=1 Tax=Pelagirhabdus alkalitolerans TaxID=1612202 RepID=A0A1G6H373_9BACI|nr:flagellar basal-body MS-ring/collar protein FliF [Pelagirhabdus alkalitolerans]SDB88603.1 flagellar M-ring protein FliF [Pelagirhabdus alkalitolerans]